MGGRGVTSLLELRQFSIAEEIGAPIQLNARGQAEFPRGLENEALQQAVTEVGFRNFKEAHTVFHRFIQGYNISKADKRRLDLLPPNVRAVFLTTKRETFAQQKVRLAEEERQQNAEQAIQAAYRAERTPLAGITAGQALARATAEYRRRQRNPGAAPKSKPMQSKTPSSFEAETVTVKRTSPRGRSTFEPTGKIKKSYTVDAETFLDEAGRMLHRRASEASPAFQSRIRRMQTQRRQLLAMPRPATKRGRTERKAKLARLDAILGPVAAPRPKEAPPQRRKRQQTVRQRLNQVASAVRVIQEREAGRILKTAKKKSRAPAPERKGATILRRLDDGTLIRIHTSEL